MMKLHRMGAGIAGVLLMAGTVVAGAQAASAANPDGSFSLVAATGKCVEILPDAGGNFYVAGNRIQQRTCDGSPQQRWFLQVVGGNFHGIRNAPRYHLVNWLTLQCLDDMDGTTTNRNPVQQWFCNGTNSMVWGLFDTSNPIGDQLVNDRSETCLDVSDGSFADGARLQIYNCFDTGNFAQHYTMQ